MKYPRAPVLPKIGRDDVDMEDLHIWDLVEAFSKLLQATLAGVGLHEVEKDDTPLALHQDDILDRLNRDGPMPFSRIFQGKTRKTEIIGLFLAMLELIRQGSIRIEQDQPFAEIYLFLKADSPDDERQLHTEEPEPENTDAMIETSEPENEPINEDLVDHEDENLYRELDELNINHDL